MLMVIGLVYMKIAEEGSGYLRGKQVEENLYEVMGLSSSAKIKDIKK